MIKLLTTMKYVMYCSFITVHLITSMNLIRSHPLDMTEISQLVYGQAGADEYKNNPLFEEYNVSWKEHERGFFQGEAFILL